MTAKSADLDPEPDQVGFHPAIVEELTLCSCVAIYLWIYIEVRKLVMAIINNHHHTRQGMTTTDTYFTQGLFADEHVTCNIIQG